jgi:DNA-binding GntR family transcriptional regulator
MIVTGEISPGQRLIETELAPRLNVSRNTLRESYRLLSRDGLVTHLHNRGVFVNRPGLPEIIDAFHVRRTIETQALIESHADHPATRRMQKAAEDGLQASKIPDWQAVGTADVEFHGAVVALADSPILDSLYAALSAQLRLMFDVLGNPEYVHMKFIDRNVDIARMVLDGDGRGAADSMRRYLLEAEAQITGAYVSGRVHAW